MIVLKPITIDAAGWLEATWVERTQGPDTEVPATEFEPARTEPGAVTEIQLWCQSYHPTQIDMLRAKAAEYGTPLDEYEPLLAEWVASYEPPPPPALDALKAEKNAEINAARLAANFSTFAHGGKQFACDQLSRSDIDGTNGFVSLYGTLPPGWPGGWKAIDNSYAPIATVTDWKAFYASMFAAGNANFAHAQALKALLAAAATADEVAAIHWGMPT